MVASTTYTFTVSAVNSTGSQSTSYNYSTISSLAAPSILTFTGTISGRSYLNILIQTIAGVTYAFRYSTNQVNWIYYSNSAVPVWYSTTGIIINSVTGGIAYYAQCAYITSGGTISIWSTSRIILT